MLRHPSLIPLSQQHHNGLALCVLTRRSLGADSSAGNIAKLARRVIDRYEIELVNHFEIEEQALFPASADAPLVAQLIAEHRAIEALVEQLRAAPSAAILEQFSALLSAHIRREERELFEQVQRALPAGQLEILGAEIDRRVVRVCLSVLLCLTIGGRIAADIRRGTGAPGVPLAMFDRAACHAAGKV